MRIMFALVVIASSFVFGLMAQTTNAPPPPQLIVNQTGIIDGVQNYLVGTTWVRERIEFSWDKKTWTDKLPSTADEIAKTKQDKYWVRHLLGDFVIRLEEIEQ